MTGKRRSGLAKDRRAYGCCITPRPPTYTITYNGNTYTSGTVPTDSSSPYTASSAVTVLGNAGLQKTGFTFAGWNTEANGSGILYLQGTIFTISANTILYAQWTPSYTVTYDGNTNTSGNVPVDSFSPYPTSGLTVTVLGNSGFLAKTGFTFLGWNTDASGSGTSYSQGTTFTITADTTLYAQWTLNPPPSTPVSLSSVGGNQSAYILFTQTGNVTNYEYSTDNGATFLLFDPPQVYSPVVINTISSDGVTRLTNGTVYTVKLKAVNAGVSSSASDPVDVTPTITSLFSSNRIIYLDANNSSSYSGSGTTWTNLASSGAYSATLNGSPLPTFNTTTPSNKYFVFNPDTVTGQYGQINQAPAINPVINQPFTIQMWVKVNNIDASGALVSKVFGDPSYDGYALSYRENNTLELHENGTSQVNYFSSATGVLRSDWALYTATIQFGNGGGRTNKIFVNGRQVSSAISNETGIPVPTQNITFPIGFGRVGKCDIGQFYYYNTELTTAQIIQNFDATKSTYNV